MLKNFLVSQLVILSAGILILISLLKSVILILFLLSRIKVFFLFRRNRILFYNSYHLPHLDFCWIIWRSCSSTLEDKLVKFQKRAARVILDCDFYTPSSELFKELNWQTFPERVTYQKAILMYRIINNIVLIILKNYVSYTTDVSCRDTRSTNWNQLYTPKPNCDVFRKSFMYSGAAIWNSFPLHVINVTSVTTIKSLYLKWKRLNGHWIISITTANLILYFVMI